MQKRTQPNKQKPFPPTPKWAREPGAEGEPIDIDALRRALLWKVLVMSDLWRECPERVCRRARTCASPRMTCATLPSRRRAKPLTPQRQAAEMAHLQKLLKRRIAEARAEEGK